MTILMIAPDISYFALTGTFCFPFALLQDIYITVFHPPDSPLYFLFCHFQIFHIDGAKLSAKM